MHEYRLVLQVYCFSEVRLDLNQSLLKYHTSLDAIVLAGYTPRTDLHIRLLTNTCIQFRNGNEEKSSSDMYDSDVIDMFSFLPVRNVTMLLNSCRV